MPNLVGTGLNQVPTNSMLGGLAYQDPEHASIKDLDLKNLSQINSEIADTAVDVFVYDTRKDSDGGAWRKRTQNTSWYNETLGTATRGTRKEFPAVAVIVAESTKVTIYDGDDPDLPMWMVFNVANDTWLKLYSSGSQCSCITALNATLCAGGGGNGIRLAVVDFIKDNQYLTEAGYTYYQTNGIITRNDTTTHTNDGGSKSIVNNVVNDVAMTVLPNAPIDDATGLPVPTIAVATQAGVSIIKDTGDVVDLYVAVGSYDTVKKLSFTDDNKIAYTVDGETQSRAFRVDSIPGSDFAVTSNQLQKQNGEEFYVTADYGLTAGDLAYSNIQSSRVNSLVKRNVAHQIGLSKIEKEKGGPRHAFVTSSFNTGWMHGDIKGAFLSDTDTTNLSGGNKVTNGDSWSGAQSSQSSTAPTGWTGGNGATFKTETGNGANGTYIRLYNADSGNGGPNSYMSQSITTVPGKKYKISVTQIHHATFSVFFRAGTQETYSDLVQNSWTSSSSNTPRYEQNTFTATGTTTYITLGIVSGTNNYSVGWDDVVVTEVDEDRSVNANGLHSFGTVPKQVVATGADLVSYGGFSNNNYLRQPYNSDLRFEQNDFSIMFWIYDTGVNEHTTIISKDEREFDISRLAAAYGNVLRIYTRNSSEDLRAPDSASALPFNKWVCVCVTYTGGNTKKVYIDGKLDITITGSNGEYDIDSTTYGLNIGVRNTGGTNAYSATGAKLALMRISGSAPSAEQVKKMYEDEKVLFQENAKATLYGSSDAVTALAYDDSTNLLYAGTSAGRNDFQGLRRINNTTTAVTTAISASNGLIAEQ